MPGITAASRPAPPVTALPIPGRAVTVLAPALAPRGKDALTLELHTPGTQTAETQTAGIQAPGIQPPGLSAQNGHQDYGNRQHPDRSRCDA